MDRPQLVGQRADLRAVGDVATEQDVAGRIGIAEERALVGGQGQAGNAEDRGSHGARIAIHCDSRKFSCGEECGLVVNPPRHGEGDQP